MSQMATYLCKIRNPNDETLEQAIDALVATINCQVVERRAHHTTIRLPDMDYSVHIGIGTSGIYVTSSKYCDRERLQNLTKQIEQLYLVMAHKAALEAMGYQVNLNQTEAGDIIVQGVMG